MASHVIDRWEPENARFWQDSGRAVARRNLWLSIPALTLAFVIWMVWSVVVVNLPNVGFGFSTDQLFWLASLPALVGATLRIFYSFMVPVFGGRRWTALSTASLLIPAIGMGLAVQDPATPYWAFVALAMLCGFGGGNFSSSMSNISFFFPKSEKGLALGLNAGLGNLGVSIVQFVVPIVIGMSVFGGEPQTWVKGTVTRPMWLQNAGFLWVPFILAASVAAWMWMNDLATAKASFSEQAVVFRRRHNWLMCVLYLGTFGSFIGYSAGFPLLIKSQFPGIDPTKYAFLGPLVGAMIRPVGGWLSDKLGGARVTLWNFVVMAVAAVGVTQFLPVAGQGGSFTGFFAMFMLLFLTTGIGNGSTFRMIPVIFLTERLRAVAGLGAAAEAQAQKDGAKEAAAVLGFSAAIGAYGGFFIPKSYGTSIAMTGGPAGALWTFAAFYLVCIAITWWFYSREGAEMPC